MPLGFTVGTYCLLKRIQVGILGNAADFCEESVDLGNMENSMDRRQMMIAFDMR